MIQFIEGLNVLIVNIYTVGVQTISSEIIDDIEQYINACNKYNLVIIEKDLIELNNFIKNQDTNNIINSLANITTKVNILYKKVVYDNLLKGENL